MISYQVAASCVMGVPDHVYSYVTLTKMHLFVFVTSAVTKFLQMATNLSDLEDTQHKYTSTLYIRPKALVGELRSCL